MGSTIPRLSGKNLNRAPTVNSVALVRPYIRRDPLAESPMASPVLSITLLPLEREQAPPAPAGTVPPRSAPPGLRRGHSRSVRAFMMWLAFSATASVLIIWALPDRPPSPRVTHPSSGMPHQAQTPPLTIPAGPLEPAGPDDAPTPSNSPDQAVPTRARPEPAATSSQDSAAGAGAGPESPAAARPRILRPGDRGDDVTRLQDMLFFQGKTYVSLTGTYDEKTRRAVQEVQQDRGITADPPGIYGPATRASLAS